MSKAAKMTGEIVQIKPGVLKSVETRLRNAAKNSNVTLQEFAEWPIPELLRTPNISWVCVRYLKQWFGREVQRNSGTVCEMRYATINNRWCTSNPTYEIDGETLCIMHAKLKALWVLETEGRAILVNKEATSR